MPAVRAWPLTAAGDRSVAGPWAVAEERGGCAKVCG